MVNYYFVGAYFDDRDMTKEFVEKGIWKLGWEGIEDQSSYKKMFRIFQQIKPGDRIVIKSAFNKKFNLPFKNPKNKVCSVMSLKALGTVVENMNDGHTLRIDWDKDFDVKDWYFYTIRSTMWKPKLDQFEVKELIKFVEGVSPQDYDWFIKNRNWIEREVNNEEGEDIYKRSDKEIGDEKEFKIGWNKILYGPPGTGKTYSIQKYREELLIGQVSSKTNGYRFDGWTWKDIILLGFKLNNFSEMTYRELSQTETIKEFAKTKRSKDTNSTISATLIEHSTESSTISNYRRGTDLFERLYEKEGYYWKVTEAGKLAADELKDYMENNKQSDEEEFFSMVTFHQSYGYEDFIEGIKAETEDGLVSYHVEDGIFKKFCLKAKEYPEENFLFVIDEINRGNISKIFGELITLIEPSKRLGAEEEMRVTLPYSKEKFGVPANVHILATMNTADRSIAMMDTALRRRFDFVEMLPDPAVVRDYIDSVEGYDVAEIMETLNKRIEVLYDREHTLGHAFFLPVSNLEDLKGVFEGKIIPTLQEYFYEDYDKIRAILNDTRGIYINIKDKEYDLFDPQFSDLLSDYDETKFCIEKNVTMENFKLFLDNIITRNVQAYEN